MGPISFHDSAIWERHCYSSAGRKTGLLRRLLLNGPLAGFILILFSYLRIGGGCDIIAGIGNF